MEIEEAAQIHELKEWEVRNTRTPSPTYTPGQTGYGPAECMGCGADMHQVRRAYGYKVCTPCQSELEAKSTGRRR